MQAGAIGGNAASQAGTTVPSPRLVRTAHEFEGQMMKELLKPLMAGDGLSGADDSGANGTLGEYASEALGQALSRQGGFGIADRIVKDLSHSWNQHDPGKVTENPHSDTVMRRFQ